MEGKLLIKIPLIIKQFTSYPALCEAKLLPFRKQKAKQFNCHWTEKIRGRCPKTARVLDIEIQSQEFPRLFIEEILLKSAKLF